MPWLAAVGLLAAAGSLAQPPAAEPDQAPLAALLRGLEVQGGEECGPSVHVVAALGPDAVLPILEHAAGRRDAYDCALDALAGMGAAAARPLARTLGDDRPGIQCMAAKALARLGPDAEPATGELAAALGHSVCVHGLAEAILAIGEAAVPATAAALGSPDTRGAAAWILSKGGRRRHASVERALAGFPPATRALALFELARARETLYRRPGLPDEWPPPLPHEPATAVAFYGRALPLLHPGGAETRDAHRTTLEQLVTLHTLAGEEALAAPYVTPLATTYPDVETAVRTVAEFHVRFGRPDVAESLYRAGQGWVDDPRKCRVLAGLLARPVWNGRARHMEALELVETCAELRPGDLAAQLLPAEHAWVWATQDPLLTPAPKALVLARGVAAADQVLARRSAHVSALEWKIKLLRLRAEIERDDDARGLLLVEIARLADLYAEVGGPCLVIAPARRRTRGPATLNLH